jgi:hypothetical protein
MDTGDYLARAFNLGRDRLLPEFTYLDQRGVGLWDSSDAAIVRPAVWALDEMDAGMEGFGGRPPPNEDGTPNETLHDQFIRLRQFLSLQESRTAGEIILIIFPDGTGPALLSCMIAGIPFSKCHVLEMDPGEVRLDVTPESIWRLYEQRKDDPKYLETIERGKDTLRVLKEKQRDGSLQEWISLKDSREEEERREIDRQYQERKRTAEQQAEKQLLLQEEQRQKRRQETRRQAPIQQSSSKGTSPAAATETADTTGNVPPAMLGLAAVAAAAAAAGLGFVGIDRGAVFARDDDPITQTNKENNHQSDVVDTVLVNNTTSVLSLLDDDSTTLTTNTISGENDNDNEDISNQLVQQQEQQSQPGNAVLPTLPNSPTEPAVRSPSNNNGTRTLVEDEFAIKLATAERNLKDALREAAVVKDRKRKVGLYGADPVGGSTVPVATSYPSRYDDDDDDDGSDDWLRVLVEIRDDGEEYFEEVGTEDGPVAVPINVGGGGSDDGVGSVDEGTSLNVVTYDAGNSTTAPSKDI